ncbi:MAG: hypothetical protein KatS3mg056_2552 [Chloroflexus sp.]|nr:MAG: hypothetical protein KatS3mg056_2552 [Chloroflexus sp.]
MGPRPSCFIRAVARLARTGGAERDDQVGPRRGLAEQAAPRRVHARPGHALVQRPRRAAAPDRRPARIAPRQGLFQQAAAQRGALGRQAQAGRGLA